MKPRHEMLGLENERREKASPSGKNCVIRIGSGWILWILPLLAFAESVSQGRVSGRVVDAATGEPLPYVNVFIANTMLGAATDQDGKFELRNIPLGVYDLVVSMVGYEVKTINIRIADAPLKPLDIRLKQKPIETAPVEVTARDPSEWRGLLKRFERLFIGTTVNAERTRIVNPEVLDLSFDEAADQFEARAAIPLVIENRALGYRLHFILQLFVERQGVTKYGGVARFEELLPADEKEELSWQKNRLRAYRGSRRHFFAALVSNRLREEGFIARLVSSIGGDVRTAGMSRGIKGPEIVSPTDNEHEKVVQFSDYLEVVYVGEAEETAYLEYPGKLRSGSDKQFTILAPRPLRDEPRGEQTSWLAMQTRSVVVNSTGLLYNPLAFVVYGYWSFERIADALPLEYVPSGSD
jgi:hypothetical protein